MKEVKLSNGFTVKVEDNAFDNIELLDALEEAREEDPLAFSKAMRIILGKEQRDALYKQMKVSSGNAAITTDEIGDVFTEIVEGLGDTAKN